MKIIKIDIKNIIKNKFQGYSFLWIPLFKYNKISSKKKTSSRLRKKIL